MNVRFADRADAARQLAERLVTLRAADPVVAAIPRGAMPLADAITRAVGGELDVVLVHKLRHPREPETVVAAVDENGHVTRRGVELTDAELAVLARPEVARLRALRREYARFHPTVDLRGRVVVVVDDGLTTGTTMAAAIHSVRVRGAGRVVVAAPVASAEALALLARSSTEVVVLAVPRPFHSVGERYDTFDVISEQQVLDVLEGCRRSSDP